MEPERTARLLRASVEGGSPWIEVRGASMGRAIPSGSRARLRLAARPRFGEVWAFCDADATVIVHRCLGRGRTGYRFRGDATGADAPVPPERLIGRVEAVESDGARRQLGRRDRWLGGARLVARVAAGRLWARTPLRLRAAVRRVALRGDRR